MGRIVVGVRFPEVRSGVFLCGFVALRAKKMPRPLSEHDLKDLWDVQDGVVSCPSFNLLNRVQNGGQGGIAYGSAVSITESGSSKVQTGEDRRCGAVFPA